MIVFQSPDKSQPPIGEIVESDGPTYNLVASDSSKNSDSASIPGVFFKWKAVKLGAKSYVMPVLSTPTAPTCPITFNESGSYAVTVSATKDTQTLEASRTITIRPITRR